MEIVAIKGTNKVVHIADDVTNWHILQVGASGSGKSVAGSILVQNAIAKGAAVIGISMNHAITVSADTAKTKIISIKKQGFPVSMISGIKNREELNDALLNAVDIFCTVTSFQYRQKKVLKDAIKRACGSEQWKENEFNAIGEELEKSSDEIAENVYAHLEPLLQNVRVYEDVNFHMGCSGENIIFDLSGYSFGIQKQLAHYILACIWQAACSGNRKEKNRWLIHLDEFQNLDLKFGSVFYQMIREGRKFNLGVLMATQTLETFDRADRALLLQAATKLFFKPELHEIPRLLRELGLKENEMILKKLKYLQKGQCLALGRYAVEKIIFDRPIVLDFRRKSTKEDM